ncbi:uncharacterized protein LOC128342437 isoform X2 [Hemicordylus capensis]|uniref:uncharacterized protein LOC128342437 isoform X2 n=1 Tax=Hemicordylus capensis TaxID=884348 RepID=UPI0023032849|nr:uncharacterized protein LOC128342437 isoform X2 [Hemicordylus capensis]
MLSFNSTKMREDETSALLPKIDKLDIFYPSHTQGNPPNPVREDEIGWARKQARQWHFHLPSHHSLDSLSSCVKYLVFLWNLAFFIIGLLILAIGLWGLSDKESLTSERITHLGSDPMLFFVLVGLAASTMSLLGCTGALIENICLLKLFTGGIITFVVLETLGGIVLYSLRHQIKASLHDSLMVAVLRYQDDPDLQFIMDEIQTGLQCCGVESYLDWKTNLYFNCSSPGVQACGVPASCCLDPLENGTIPNSQCGFGALGLEEFVAQSTIYLGGCVPQLSRWLNNHAGAIAFCFVFLIVIEVGSLLLVTKLLAGVTLSSGNKCLLNGLQQRPSPFENESFSADTLAMSGGLDRSIGSLTMKASSGCWSQGHLNGLSSSPAPRPKKKTNSKPKCLNEQEIPYRLREIMKGRDELKNPKKKKKKKKKTGNNWEPRAEGDIRVPKFRRRKGESESSYIRRMEQETQHVIFLTKNQLQREPEKEEPIQEKSQKKKEFQQKKLDKIRKQKEEKKADIREKDLLKDTVKFGEVALQPPTLTAKPRKSVLKAGQRQLLLMSLLGSDKTTSTHKAVPASLARQRIVQEERERVVQAYRDIKKRRQQQQLSSESQLAMDKLRKPV